MFSPDRSAKEQQDITAARPEDLVDLLNTTKQASRTVVTITDHYAIMQWDDDGGKPVEIIYDVLQEPLPSRS